MRAPLPSPLWRWLEDQDASGIRRSRLALVECSFYGEALAHALHALDDAGDGRPPIDELPSSS